MSEQIKFKIRNIIILLIIFVVIFNIYFCFAQSYVSVYDNLNNKSVMDIKYLELFEAEESFSYRISMYLIDEPAEQDSKNFEIFGVILMLVSNILFVLGLIAFITKEKFGFIITGVISGCIGIGCLYMIVDKVDKAIQESMLGTLESLFGKGSIIVIKTTSGTYALLEILFSVIICILAYVYYRITISIKSNKIQE